MIDSKFKGRKFVSLILVAALIATIVIIPATAGVANAREDKVVLKVWAPKSVDTQKSVKEAELRFQKQHPNIEIVRESFEDPVAGKTKFLAAIKAGNAPDVGFVNLWWLPDFAMNGWLVPLDSFADQRLKADILPPFIRSASHGGKLYGLFSGTDCAVVVYRKDLLKKAGIKPPAPGEAWTQAQFIAAAKKLTKPGVWGLGINAKREGPTTYTQLPFFWMQGGKILDKNGKPAFNSPAAVKSFQFYHDLVYKHKVTPPEITSYGFDDVARGVAAGRFAMALMGSWQPSNLEKMGNLKGKIGVMLYPVPKKGMRPTTIHGGWPMVILTKDKKKQEAAWKYISYMFSTKVQSDMTKEQGNLPVRKSIYQNDAFFKTRWMKVFQAQLMSAKHKPGDPIYMTVQDEYTIALIEVLMNKKTPKQALRDAEDRVEKRARAGGLWQW
ncbi:MAG: ABC transporter substrate-binding protein [Actinobacteria bacterium]|nr:ABC transporter substrate-binding protein [Actinomycetota bacterium]